MLAIPMTILGIVGVCNSINMVDGLDGGISLTAFSAFAFRAKELIDCVRLLKD